MDGSKMSDWKKCRIRDIAASMGDAPFGSDLKTIDYTSSGALVIQGKNIQGRKFDWTDRRYVSMHKYKSLPRSHCQIGDLIFPKVGTIGKVGILTPCENQTEYMLSTNTMRLRTDANVACQEYVYYYFSLPQTMNLIQALNSKSVQPVFNFTSLKNFEIVLPPLVEQRAIARILGTLDDKIELNRQMNATLEALARALFQSWFVDFDPVRAKAAGRTPHGMDAATAALFPDGFEESELGTVPQGWRALPVSDLFEVAIGKTPPRNEHQWFSTSHNDIPWMSIRDLGNSNAFIARTSEFLTSEAVEKFRVKRIPNGTVVLSFKLTVGRVAITDGEMLSNEAIAHFRPRSRTGTASEYLYCYLKQFRFDSLGSTSSIATAVNSDSVRSIPILVPSDDINRLFSSITTSYFQKIRLLQRESYTIAALRDTLLPRLLSGELRVGEAEQMVTEVA